MSKISKAVSAEAEKKSLRLDETVKNFMDGDSYTLNPLITMKMLTAASIFGEPQYYRGSELSTKYTINDLVESILPETLTKSGLTTEGVMLDAIDAALNYDFEETINWAIVLRRKYCIRLNPQIIMVRAAMHPKRIEFTSDHPGSFININDDVMRRPDEPMTQFALYLYFNGSKNNLPTILKRSWAKKLGSLKAKSVAKYKNAEVGMINTVRVCHATSDVIDELMKTGTVAIDDTEKTWENLRSEGKSWQEIYGQIKIGHMAMLRNLRGVFTEVDDTDFCKKYLEELKAGVKGGMQLPFRYYSAMKAIRESTCNHQQLILDALEDCMDLALDNCPKLSGKTVCLSDNSGSAWGGFTSEYGTVTVADIDNLSSVITAACSDEGYVVKFGNSTKTFPISKRNGILIQAQRISEAKAHDVGGGATEGGIWEFFDDAIRNRRYYDNIFIYSDQQAGHGGLYGTDAQASRYRSEYGCNYHHGWGNVYINVFKLIQDYRKKVNPKVNVFTVQTAGYDNTLLPEYAYRTAILYGWTGREAEFAKAIIDVYNSNESITSK